MTKYRLKNKFGHEFVANLIGEERLQKEIHKFLNGLHGQFHVIKTMVGNVAVALRIDKEDLEIVHEKKYNPYGWNKFPEITPPEGVAMRVEVTTQRNIELLTCPPQKPEPDIKRFVLTFKNGEWRTEHNELFIITQEPFETVNVLFRPWW